MRFTFNYSHLLSKAPEDEMRPFKIKDLALRTMETPKSIKGEITSVIGKMQIDKLHTALSIFKQNQADELRTDKFFKTLNRRGRKDESSEQNKSINKNFRLKVLDGSDNRGRRHFSLNLKNQSNSMAKPSKAGNPELVKMLKEKLKDREVRDLKPLIPKVIEYVETKGYLKSKIEERLRIQAEQKAHREARVHTVSVNNNTNRNKETLLKHFVTKRREYKKVIEAMVEQKKRVNDDKLRLNVPIVVLIMFTKILKMVKSRLAMKRVTRVMDDAKKTRLDICSRRLKVVSAVLANEKTIRAGSLMLGYAKLKFGCFTEFNQHKQIVSKILMAQYLSKKIEIHCEKLRHLFRRMTQRLRRSNFHRRFFYRYIQNHTFELYNRVRSKIPNQDFVDRYFKRICKVFYLLDLNTRCNIQFIKYNALSFEVTNPKDTEERFYNEVVSIILYYFPVKNTKHYSFTVDKFLRHEDKPKIFGFIETLMVNIYIGKFV